MPTLHSRQDQATGASSRRHRRHCCACEHFQRETSGSRCHGLQRLGFSPFYLRSIFERDIYFAGSAEQRGRELEEMFERDEVQAILCARGGYGSNTCLTGWI